jgi:hypothetical protein
MRLTLKPSCSQALTREWTLPKVSSIHTSPLSSISNEEGGGSRAAVNLV